MTTKDNTTTMPATPPHKGGGWEGVSIKNREAFFRQVEKGLKRYFDKHDSNYTGVISLTIGVKNSKVGGIAKSEGLFYAYQKGGEQ